MAENNNYPDTVDSRSVDIIETIINQEEYDIPPQSRLEEVLLELKEAIEEGGGGSANIYRTTTALTDGATTNPITVDDESVTVESGDFAIYDTQEFIFDGTQWNLLGDRVGLGELAYLDRSDMGELAFEDLEDLDLGELAMKDADDIHREISDVEYEALPAAKKNNGTEYFVYETGDDNRSIICKDANGNFKYRAFVYGVAANNSGTGWGKSATDSDAPTTPPTKVNPQLSGTSLIWGFTTSEKTVYFNRFPGNAPNGANAIDKDASNIGFALTGNVNNQYSLTKNGTAWITANFVETLSTDVVTLGKEPTGKRYIKAYNKSYSVGGFTRTVLYDSGGYDQYAPFQTDVPLLDNLSNYDFIVVSVGTDGNNTRLGKYECDSAVYDVQLILRNDYYAHYAGYQRRWCDIHFTDTTFNIMNSEAPDESSSLKPCVYFIVGYKFG